MEVIELKILTDEEVKRLSKKEILSVVTLSFILESALADNKIFLRSVFIDTISKAILDEQKSEKLRN